MVRTLLVDLPFMSVHRPNLALTLLRGALEQAGHSCDILYGKLAFAREIGTDLYRVLSDELPQELLIGDFIFGELLGPAGEAAFVPAARRRAGARDEGLSDLWPRLPALRRAATRFLHERADAIAAGGYDLVGLNLTFQLSPALSFAKLLKARHPALRIVVGGGNCEGEPGLTMHRRFPWVDFVCRGEGERLIVELADVLDGRSRRRAPGRLPLADDSGGGSGLAGIQGLIWRHGGETIANGSRAANIEDLDSLPLPDYHDYFEQFDAAGLGLRRRELSMPFETSRGCWFGEKMHCTFCGLNGPSLRFRSKRVPRVVQELRQLAAWGVPNADAVDLILDVKYFDTLLPEIARDPPGLALFFELKSNLRRAQVQALQAAGIALVQPGIESLHSGVLALMRKGVSAYQNVRLLKWCAEAGISVQWNLLHGFPGEDPDAYREIAALVPRLVHLQPPGGGCMRVLLNRFSPLFFDAERLGVRAITPVPAYAQIFGDWVDDPAQLAYYFDFEPAGGPSSDRSIHRLREAVSRWQRLYGTAAFTMLDRAGTLYLYDSRPDAREETATLGGAERLVYLACDEGATVTGVSRTTGIDGPSAEAILRGFAEHGWIVELDGRHVSLAVAMDHAVPPDTPPRLWRALSTVKYRQMTALCRTPGGHPTQS